MGTEQKGFIVYKDIHAVVDELTDEQAGQLFKGMINYSSEGTEPDFDGILKFVFIPIKQQMDRDAEKYIVKCEKMKSNANKRWNAKASKSMQLYANDANTNTDTDTDTKTNTDTDTTTTTDTNTNVGGGGDYVGDISYTDIWKSLTPQDVDSIYEVYPESGTDLIQTVYEDVKAKKKTVKQPVSYILGYAKKIGWDDKAVHFDY